MNPDNMILFHDNRTFTRKRSNVLSYSTSYSTLACNSRAAPAIELDVIAGDQGIYNLFIIEFQYYHCTQQVVFTGSLLEFKLFTLSSTRSKSTLMNSFDLTKGLGLLISERLK